MKNNVKRFIIKQKELANIEAIEKIEECRKSYSKKLDLSCSGYLSELPEEIRKLKWLTSLSFAQTDISIIPEWIGELENLEELDFHFNDKINNLPPNMVNLKNLKKLIFSNTGIIYIPSFIGKIHSLEILEINENTSDIPQCIFEIPRLKRIDTIGYDKSTNFFDISSEPWFIEKQQELSLRESIR